jgi:hypothetical protein
MTQAFNSLMPGMVVESWTARESVDFLIDSSGSCIDSVGMLEEKARHEPMMVARPAAQRCLQFGRAAFDPRVSRRRQRVGVGFPGRSMLLSIDHRTDP